MAESDLNSDIDYPDFELNSKKHSRANNKIRKNFNEWNVDKTRWKRIVEVSNLGIPRQSTDILVKLVINHQLLEIVKVMKVDQNSVTYQAKFDLAKETFCHLDSNDVIMKIFTMKNHLHPNVEAAKLYHESIKKKNFEWTKPSSKKYFVHRTPILRVENVLIMKVIVYDDRSLFQMKKIIDSTDKIFQLHLELQNNHKKFKDQESSVWNEIIKRNRQIRRYQSIEYTRNFRAHHFISAIKVFLEYGVTWTDLKDAFLNSKISKGITHDWDHVVCLVIKPDFDNNWGSSIVTGAKLELFYY